MSCLCRKLLLAFLVVCSIGVSAQRPRWSPQTYALTASPSKVVVADVNVDGNQDLVVAIDLLQQVAVLLGNGNGTFQSPKYSPYSRYNGLDIVVADFNGDRKPDLATAGFLYIGTGTGYFQYAGSLPKSGTSVVGGDFNKDGKADLVVFDAPDDFGPLYQWTLLGTGLGGFTPMGGLTDLGYGLGVPDPIYSTELNGDGKPDLFMRFSGGKQETPDAYSLDAFIEIGNGDGSFTQPPAPNDKLSTFGLGDVNGDGKLDFVTAGIPYIGLDPNGIPYPSAPEVHTYFGNGNGTFQPFVISTINCSGSFAMGDLNGDGRSDLLCSASGKLTFYSSTGNGQYTQGITVSGGGVAVIADLNKDGAKDAILLNGDSSATVLLNFSGTSMSASTSVSTLVYKQPFSLNTSVTPSLTQIPKPSGSVTYKDGMSTLGSAGLGYALYRSAGLTVGTHTLSFSYGGDSNFNPHTVTLSRTVGKAASTTKVTASLNPSVHGQAVTFTASVSPQFAGVPTGKITFKDGTSILATVTMSSGKATYTTSSLTVGTHSITAAYSGDGNFKSSTSAVLYQKVN